MRHHRPRPLPPRAGDLQPGEGRGDRGETLRSGSWNSPPGPDIPQTQLHLLRRGLQHPSQRHQDPQGLGAAGQDAAERQTAGGPLRSRRLSPGDS